MKVIEDKVLNAEIITNNYVEFDQLSIQEQIDYIEFEAKFYNMERSKRKFLNEVKKHQKEQGNFFLE